MGISLNGSNDPRGDWMNDITIRGVEIAYAATAIQSQGNKAGVTDILIEGCNIHHCLAEGIYGQFHEVIVRGCNISWINTGWYNDYNSGGDCLQLASHYNPMATGRKWATIIVEYNYVDKHETGHKFIHHHAGYEQKTDSTIVISRYNTFILGKDTAGVAQTTSGVYFDNLGFAYIIGNKFIGRGIAGNASAGSAIWCDAAHEAFVIGNLFDSVTNISFTGPLNYKKQLFYNNTVIGARPDRAVINIVGDSVHIANNIFALHSGRSAEIPVIDGAAASKVDSSYNLVKIGDSLNWNTYFGLTDWNGQDFTLTGTGANAVKYGKWIEDMYTYYNRDIDSVEVPQTNNVVYQDTLVDIGAYQYDLGLDPVFPPILYFDIYVKDLFTGEWVLIDLENPPTVDTWVKFVDNSLRNPTSIAWSFGTDSIFIAFSGQGIYPFPGTYSVTDTATNSDGTVYLTKTDSVVIVASTYPVAGFNSSRDSTIVDSTNVFTNTSLNSPTNFIWRVTGGLFEFDNGTVYTDTNVEIKFLSDAIYTVTLVANKGVTMTDYYSKILDGSGGECPTCPDVNPPDIVIDKHYYR
jgi:hypothetical protein